MIIGRLGPDDQPRTTPVRRMSHRRRLPATGRSEDLQRVDRQQEVRPTELDLVPRGVGKAVLARGVGEEPSLHRPALAGDELGLQQVERVRASLVGDIPGAGEDVEPGHEVVEPRVGIRQLGVDVPERLPVGPLQVDLALEQHLGGGVDGLGELVARAPRAVGRQPSQTERGVDDGGALGRRLLVAVPAAAGPLVAEEVRAQLVGVVVREAQGHRRVDRVAWNEPWTRCVPRMNSGPSYSRSRRRSHR